MKEINVIIKCVRCGRIIKNINNSKEGMGKACYRKVYGSKKKNRILNNIPLITDEQKNNNKELF